MYSGYQRFFVTCDDWVVLIKTRPVKSLLHLGERGWTWMQTFVCKNMIKESRAVGPDWNFADYFFNLLNFVYQKFNTPLPRIFQISEKLNNIIQVHGMSSQLSCGGRGVLLRILGGGVPRGALNPDPILDQKCHFSHPFSDLVPKKFMSSLIHRWEQQQKTRIHI